MYLRILFWGLSSTVENGKKKTTFFENILKYTGAIMLSFIIAHGFIREVRSEEFMVLLSRGCQVYIIHNDRVMHIYV